MSFQKKAPETRSTATWICQCARVLQLRNDPREEYHPWQAGKTPIEHGLMTIPSERTGTDQLLGNVENSWLVFTTCVVRSWKSVGSPYNSPKLEEFCFKLRRKPPWSTPSRIQVGFSCEHFLNYSENHPNFTKLVRNSTWLPRWQLPTSGNPTLVRRSVGVRWSDCLSSMEESLELERTFIHPKEDVSNSKEGGA